MAANSDYLVFQLTRDKSNNFPTSHPIYLDKATHKLVKRREALQKELQTYKNTPSTVSSNDLSYYQNLVTTTETKISNITTTIDNSSLNIGGTDVINIKVVTKKPLEGISGLRIQIPWLQRVGTDSIFSIHRSDHSFDSTVRSSNLSSILVPLDSKTDISSFSIPALANVFELRIPYYFVIDVYDSIGNVIPDDIRNNISEIIICMSD